MEDLEVRVAKERRAIRLLWGLAALFGMMAAFMTWILGFFIIPQATLVSTTLALIIGLGGFWMFDVYKRRWSWAMVLFGVPAGFFLPKPAGNSYIIPSLTCILSLLLAASGAMVGVAKRSKHRPPQDDADAFR